MNCCLATSHCSLAISPCGMASGMTWQQQSTSRGPQTPAEQMSKATDLWHCMAQLVRAEWPERQVSMHGLKLTNCGSCEPASACRGTESACTASRVVKVQPTGIAPAVVLGHKLADSQGQVACAPSRDLCCFISMKASCWTVHLANSDWKTDLQCLRLMARPAGQAVPPGHCPSRLQRLRWHSSACHAPDLDY